MSEKISGSDIMLRSLIRENVDLIFGYPGGSIMPFYDRMYDYQKEIKHILVRHEQGATHAAQGYARVTGRPGVVVVTSGPAATNVITGLADAQMDSTPLVVITGQVASSLLGTDAFQETDVVGITQPITKWAYQIRRAEDIAWAVARAFYIASTGRPGPVVLDFTMDAQKGLAEFDYKPCEFIRSYIPRPDVNAQSVADAAALINAAERPMILAGHGVMLSNAEKELIAFAEKADIPVAATLLGLSVVPSDNPLYVGMLGMHGNIAPNINTNKADLLIAVGMRFDSRITGRVSTYAPNAKVVHIDIDEAELGKIINAHVAVHADAGDALRALIPLVHKADHAEWRKSFEKPAQIERERVIEREIHPTGDRMLMGEVINKVSEASRHSAVIVTDVGQNQMFSARYSRFTQTRSLLTSGGLGTMGFGLPAAIGAKMGAPDRTVCLFVGDGGLQMTIQEFGTILEYQTDVKIILLNNNFLGNVRQWQALFFGGRFSQTPMINPDFVAVADAYGIAGEDVAERKDLDAAIERMLAHKGAYLLNVNIDETDMVFPMTPAGCDVDYIMLNATDCYPNN
jgi:acetolactate synthase-1/2/3 large subunit